MHKISDYINELKNGNLLGFECMDCHHKWLTMMDHCPKCGSKNIRDANLSKSGIIISYNIQKVVPTQFQEKVPYAIAIIVLDDGARIQARIENINENEDLYEKRAIFEKGDENGIVFKIEK